MPRIPWNQLYPAMDQHPPKWVRSADGSRYEPDWSDYPVDAPRWRVSHIDPVTGFPVVELPTVEMEPEEDGASVEVDDDQQDLDAGAGAGVDAEADSGGAQGAA